uniref:NYN domain-containing protein n=1 Tax=Noccaea caerulescens TaxID=107243 RepID=A0A1J3IMB9_NOCCA
MGDESVWKTQQFPLTFYKEGEADTCVFWDLNDYPIPIGVHPAWIYKRIKDAISDQGIVGDVSIHGYVDVSEREYWDAGFQVEVFPQSEGGKHTRHCSMLVDMSIWALNHTKPSNVIILAQVTDDLLDGHFRSYCSRIYGYLFSRQRRVPARSDPTFLTCIFDQQREQEKEE